LIGLDSRARPNPRRPDMGGEKVKEWLAGRFCWLRHYRTDADLSDELKTHLEMLEEDYVEAGIPVAEARRRARLALGSRQAVVENVRDQEFITMLESCYRDFVLGLRVLRKSPVFMITATVTLALGIGANVAIFTIVRGVLLRPLDYPKPDQLMY